MSKQATFCPPVYYSEVFVAHSIWACFRLLFPRCVHALYKSTHWHCQWHWRCCRSTSLRQI